MQTDNEKYRFNTELWRAVSQTDPAHTRHINQRGGFTAIDSYYQIQRATELFGPLGQGWGFDAEYRFEQNLAIAIVKLWYVWKGVKSEPFTVCAANQLSTADKSGAVRVDEDAAKKALTDAITKGLSYLGFSADVFMGKFDDNRYVEGLKQRMGAQQQERDLRLELAELEDELQSAIESVTDSNSYHLAREKMIPNFLRIKALAPNLASQYEASMLKLKEQYTPKPETRGKAKDAAKEEKSGPRADHEAWLTRYEDHLSGCIARDSFFALMKDKKLNAGLTTLHDEALDLYDRAIRAQSRQADLLQLNADEYAPDPEAWERICLADKSAIRGASAA